MISPTLMSASFDRNRNVLRRLTESLDHTDSLIQPPFQANCLNWVLGHILSYRDDLLELLGQTAILEDPQRSRYGNGSAPVTADGPHVLTLERQLEVLEQGQDVLGPALENLVENDLEEEIAVRDRKTTRAERLFFLYFHDTYHTGQVDLLVQMIQDTRAGSRTA